MANIRGTQTKDLPNERRDLLIFEIVSEASRGMCHSQTYTLVRRENCCPQLSRSKDIGDEFPEGCFDPKPLLAVQPKRPTHQGEAKDVVVVFEAGDEKDDKLRNAEKWVLQAS